MVEKLRSQELPIFSEIEAAIAQRAGLFKQKRCYVAETRQSFSAHTPSGQIDTWYVRWKEKEDGSNKSKGLLVAVRREGTDGKYTTRVSYTKRIIKNGNIQRERWFELESSENESLEKRIDKAVKKADPNLDADLEPYNR